MAKELSNENYQYFSVDSDGYIYLKSKEQLEGYKPYYNKDNVLLGYKKIFSATDLGLIKHIGIREVEFPTGKAKMVSITIQGESGMENVQFQLKNSKNQLTDHTRYLAMVLPNVDFSKKYSLSFSKKKNERGFTDKRVYFNDENGEAVSWFHKFKNKEDNNGGDVPVVEWKEGIDSVEADHTNRDKFLYESLTKQIERFEDFVSGRASETVVKTETPSVEKKSVVKKEVKTSATKNVNVPVAEDDDDDLPF